MKIISKIWAVLAKNTAASLIINYSMIDIVGVKRDAKITGLKRKYTNSVAGRPHDILPFHQQNSDSISCGGEKCSSQISDFLAKMGVCGILNISSSGISLSSCFAPKRREVQRMNGELQKDILGITTVMFATQHSSRCVLNRPFEH